MGKAMWEGYQEDGLPGALNAVNPLYWIGRGAADTYIAAEKGDYRAATAAGLKTAVVVAATAATAAQGVGALGRATGAARGGGRSVFGVGPYRPSAAPLENHHGVLDVWASHNIPGYVSRGANTPTIALTGAQHAATKAVYRDWLFEQTGRRVGGSVNWSHVSPREIQSLTNRMLDAAGVPGAARAEYFRVFHQYIYGVVP
jgi:hypothetical protein